jgi:imidazolonepropionase-like amidohydrolase
MNPQLSPEGDNLVFGAAGYLWQQSLDGGEAQRLIESSAHILQPAMSPDGRQLAFIHSEHGRQEVRLFDFQSGEARTMAYGQRYGQPSWTRDGQRLVFTQYQNQGAIVAIVNLSDGKQDKLIDIPNSNWRPRAHLSADNGSLYYSAKLTDTGGLHRLSLNESAESQPVTNLAHDLHDGLVSPDEKWLAFRRNTEIWVARLGAEPVEEKDVLLFSKEGGQDFVFTSDSSSVIYASGAKIWRQSLAGGEPDEIRIRLELPHPTPPPLLLRQVHMLDFDAGGFGPEVSLLVEQGRISWIGPERGRNIPPETVILEGAGRFAIPGLFDSHVHNIGSNQAAFLAYGITSVRDPGGRLTYLNAMADRVETSTDAGPRYFFSGDIFHGAQPFFIELLRISNADEARTYVRRWKEQGAQFIKVYPDMSWPLKRAVAQEARRLDLPVAGHGMSVEEITNSVTLGFAVLEHVSMNHRLYDDVLQMLAAAGTRWTPTLGVLLGNELLLREEPERLYDPKLRAFATDRTLHNARVGWKTIGTRDIRGYLFEQLAGIRAANDRGVKILAGTDSQPGALLGVTLHWELELFALAGLPPLDLLRIATKEAAATVGAADDLGELEPGKLADIVLLDKNPLEDIRNAKSIWRTVKGGWVYNPDELRPSESIVNGK